MKRLRRILKFLSIAALAGVLLVLAAETFIDIAASGRIYDDIAKIPKRRVGLVLGTGKYVAVGRGNLFYSHRIAAAADLFNAGKVGFLIVSGDNGRKTYNEPDIMKRDLIARGVPEEKIYCDYAGFRTLDSMIRAKKIFGLDEVTVISQKFHCQRAIFLAQNNGLDAIGFEAKAVEGSEATRTIVRERIARMVAVLDAKILHRGPRYLGPPIVIGTDPPPKA